MISTKNINYLTLSKENILKFITEEEIFRKYIKYDFKINEIFSAPYRKDNHPSFGIYFNIYNNRLMFKDLGKKIGGDCFSYVMLIFNCDFWEACKIINNDFKLNLGTFHVNMDKIIKDEENEPKTKEKRIISIDKQEFTEQDLLWWDNYGISEQTLKYFNVFSVKTLYINKVFKRAYTKAYPIYAYYFPRTGNYKIYIPNENKWNKWDTNANNNWDIQGYDQLPEKGDIIYITKSMKDVMVLYELGYSSVATHGEGQWFNPDFFRHLKGRFKKIILFYDHDESGIECTQKILNEYNDYELSCIFTPTNLEKDISDYVKNKGKEEGKRIIDKFDNYR